MSNKTLFFILWGMFFLLSAALLRAAIRYNQWTAFYVSEFHLLVAAGALSWLLRAPNKP